MRKLMSLLAILFLTLQSAVALAAELQTAVLPGARSITVNNLGTAFSTVINSSTETGNNCLISIFNPDVSRNIAYGWYLLDAAGQIIPNPANPRFSIAPGETKRVILVFFPQETFPTTMFRVGYNCNGTTTGLGNKVIPHLNTLTINAPATAGPDVVSVLSTPTNDGVLKITAAGQTAAMGLAAVNIGAAGNVEVKPVNNTTLPVDLTICENNASGSCIANPTTAITRQFFNNETATFTVFATLPSEYGILFQPDHSQLSVQFSNPGSNPTEVFGYTTVAVEAPIPATGSLIGVYSGKQDNDDAKLIVAKSQSGDTVVRTFSAYQAGFEASDPGNGVSIIHNADDMSEPSPIFSGVGFKYNSYTIPDDGCGYTIQYFRKSAVVGSCLDPTVSYDSLHFSTTFDALITEAYPSADLPVGRYHIYGAWLLDGYLDIGPGGSISGTIIRGPVISDPVDCQVTGNAVRVSAGKNVWRFDLNAGTCTPFSFYGYRDPTALNTILNVIADEPSYNSGGFEQYRVVDGIQLVQQP